MTDRPIHAQSAEDVLRIAGDNPWRKYPAPQSQGDRLYPIARPRPRPSFAIAPGDSIYAMGSCFARNLEGALDQLGLEVLSRRLNYADMVPEDRLAANFLNKYSIHSMLNDLEWALDPSSYPGETAVFHLPRGANMIFDPQLGIPKLPGPVADVLAFKERYFASVGQIFQADVIILTLGYVETWFDIGLGRYLNLAPPRQVVEAHPGRFEFRVLSYEDVLAGLRRFHALLVAHRDRPLRLLATVSPVPMAATFRDCDVLTANAYSKAVQRAALEQFAAETEGVDYFPSYESVALSDPAVAWRADDYRHVSGDMVMQIMDSVLRAYMGEEVAAQTREDTHPDATILAEARLLSRAENWTELAALLDADPAVMDRHPNLIGMRATACKALGDLDGCYAILHRGHSIAPEQPGFVERMVWVSVHAGETLRAQQWFRYHRDNFPDRHADFRAQIGASLDVA
ncbi:GSCFA domain-containing protein [Rhodovulum adriaticum]|uniref:GSCFA family protein n=1 Tax=Rhodovulum adriaticum TaxID=35804 RepID=A0A4R2NYI7_RHOAD|nr:GSCFA domain-containing protein [Rhodovulum adriaticum]MBK1636849.1 hypothetical protein [Rhodovulum adriaticum]TCP27343.1 GSCFA family protein [Rhodovulum adriaticum]